MKLPSCWILAQESVVSDFVGLRAAGIIQGSLPLYDLVFKISVRTATSDMFGMKETIHGRT